MKTIKSIIYAIAALMMVFACTPEEVYEVKAGFTTDKAQYSVGDLVTITNTATCSSNTMIASCQWQYLGKSEYNLEAPQPFYVEEAGDLVITQTVITAHGAKTDTYTLTIPVVDDNAAPVADFSWKNAAGEDNGAIAAGEEITFIDKSSDSDGSLTAWEWSFGGDIKTLTSATEAAAYKYTFASHGDIEITLKVTDDRRKSHSVTKKITVGRSATSMGLLWKYAYAAEGKVIGTSPAVSPDNQHVYVTSSDYRLVGVKAGAAGGTEAYNVDLTGGFVPTYRDEIALTPSVGADGTAYAAGYISVTNVGYYAVKNGTVSYTGDLGAATKAGHYYWGSPALLNYKSKDYVVIASKNMKNENPGMGGSSAHTQVLEASSGAGVIGLHSNSGSYGSPVVLKNGVILASSGGKWGYRVYLPKEDGTWAYNEKSDNNNGNLGTVDNQLNCVGSYMAVNKNGTTVYIMGKGEKSKKNEVHCYDLAEVIAAPNTITPLPVWKYTMEGGAVTAKVNVGGVVLDEAGNVYATSPAAEGETGHVIALTSAGAKIWDHAAEGDVNGAPAVGNDGAVYYNDSATGCIVKLDAKTGEKLVSFKLGDSLISSPTIGPDGVIYCTGVLEGKPTVFAVEATATAPADSWSQMGGDYTKASNRY